MNVLQPLNEIVTFSWSCLLLLWIVGAMLSKPTRRRKPWQAVFLRLLLPAVALSLILDYFRISFLGRQMLPPSGAAMWTGFVFALGGVIFACWARIFLGSNWSGYVSIKEGHTLVRRGPYRLVRHPIYTGLLAGGLGTALLHGYTRCFIAMALITLVFWIKLRMEEQFMVQEFGDQYLLYRRQVKALIPFVI